MNKKDCENIGRILSVLDRQDNILLPDFFKLDSRIKGYYDEWKDFIDGNEKYAERIDELMTIIYKERHPMDAWNRAQAWALLRDHNEQKEIRRIARERFLEEVSLNEDEKEARELYLKFH